MAKRQKKQPENDGLELLEQAMAGDPDAVSILMQGFDEFPELPQRLGDLPRLSENTLIDAVAGSNAVLEEAIRRRLGKMKADLAGSDPSAPEMLLAERIGICWLQMHQSEMVHAQALKKSHLSFEEAKYYERRLDQTQRRYLAAIKSLAQVRRLLGITVQVNIADQQVNVAG